MKNKYPELLSAYQNSLIQEPIYQPSSFWEGACRQIIHEIEEYGIDNFRNIRTSLSFFVPTYGVPANSFTKEIANKILKLLEDDGSHKQKLAMQEFLYGYFYALSDYRVFISSDNKNICPNLSDFSESKFGNPIEQFQFGGKKYSRSSLNYILGICFLKKYLNNNEEIKTVLEIGGGFGTLGEILNCSGDIKYINIDIPPISFIAWKYLSKIYCNNNIEPFIHNKKEIIIDDLNSCSIFNSWDIEKLEGTIDLFVNFISFQEMEPDIVENYLNHVKRLNTKWILLRNMREGKQIKKTQWGVGVEIPIIKDTYIKMIEDKYSLVATNVFPFGYKTVDGFHSELLLFKRKDV